MFRLFNPHSASDPDPLLRPMQSTRSRVRRLIWQAAWVLLCRWTPAPLHRWRCTVLRLFGARLGRDNLIYPSARIWAPWLLETGDVVTLGRAVEAYNVGGVRIGHRAIVSEGALLCGATHDYQDPEFRLVPRPIEIGACAWICARAVVLPGVRCGEGAVLGAAGVASRDLEAWGVYAGNPARRVAGRHRQSTERDVGGGGVNP